MPTPCQWASGAEAEGPVASKVLTPEVAWRIWKVSGQPCGKRLVKMLGLWIPRGEAEHGQPAPKELTQSLKSAARGFCLSPCFRTRILFFLELHPGELPKPLKYRNRLQRRAVHVFRSGVI